MLYTTTRAIISCLIMLIGIANARYCLQFFPPYQEEYEREYSSIKEKQENAMNDPVKEALAHNDKLVVSFIRPTCPFCSYISPIFQDLAKSDDEDICFMEVNISERPTYFKDTYGFSTVPTIIYFSDGKAVRKHGSDNMGMTLDKMKNICNQIYR